MQTAANYIDQALALGAQELLALENGDVDGAMEIAGQRSWVLSQAWEARMGCDEAAYKERLHKVYDMQTSLTQLAQEKREELRVSLLGSRKQERRLVGYRQALTHAV